MTSFSSLSEFAIDEFATAGVELFVPNAAVGVTVYPPEVLAGATVDVPTVAIGVAALAPANVLTPPPVAAAFEVLPPTVLAGASVDVPLVEVSATPLAPTVAAGALVEVPSVSVAANVLPPRVGGGVLVEIPQPVEVSVLFPKPRLSVVGTLIDVGNTISVPTEGSLSETAITEQAEDNVFLVAPRIAVRFPPPEIVTGTTIDVPAVEFFMTVRPPAISARPKPIRIQAVAS